jgi:hypothetical protein
MPYSLADLIKPRIRKPKVVKPEKLDIRPERVKLPNIAFLPPLSKRLPIDKPVVTKGDLKPNLSRHQLVLLRALLSKYPHYKFVEIHRCSWSNNLEQFIFLDTDSNTKLALTYPEIEHKIRAKSEGHPTHSSYERLPSFDDIQEN